VALQIKFKITPQNVGDIWKSRMAGLQDRLYAALTAAANMAASLIQDKARADIASAGNFGARWTDGLEVTVEGAAPNMILSMTHKIPWAGIFETGGTISGDLLWIPLSGTDAAGIRASAFPGGLFSAKYPRQGGKPLLFSMQDKKPRYFGVESVTIPKKFQLTEDVTSVMANFRAIFDDAWKAA
jgi:hypothetical protein